MIYKSNVRFSQYQIARLGENFGDVVRREFAYELGRHLGPKLTFSLPAPSNAPEIPYYIPQPDESITSEYVLMPIEQWLEIKTLLMIVVESGASMSHRQLIYTAIGEIENT